ncbi:hypothetical protein Ddc_11676 [Ditylenchus destructor]|nr:hypothetical protein Ddc_11676 [Ditylenchus destructor]
MNVLKFAIVSLLFLILFVESAHSYKTIPPESFAAAQSRDKWGTFPPGGIISDNKKNYDIIYTVPPARETRHTLRSQRYKLATEGK